MYVASYMYSVFRSRWGKEKMTEIRGGPRACIHPARWCRSFLDRSRGEMVLVLIFEFQSHLSIRGGPANGYSNNET